MTGAARDRAPRAVGQDALDRTRPAPQVFGMKTFSIAIVAAVMAVAPAVAQDDPPGRLPDLLDDLNREAPDMRRDLSPEGEAPSLMERGMRLFMEGLMEEMEPALRDLGDLAREAGPLLEDLERELGSALEGFGGSLGAYDPPEVLPNGDIIIRRKEPLPQPDERPGRNSDGSVDL